MSGKITIYSYMIFVCIAIYGFSLTLSGLHDNNILRMVLGVSSIGALLAQYELIKFIRTNGA